MRKTLKVLYAVERDDEGLHIVLQLGPADEPHAHMQAILRGSQRSLTSAAAGIWAAVGAVADVARSMIERTQAIVVMHNDLENDPDAEALVAALTRELGKGVDSVTTESINTRLQ
jgi:uncharacterized lipoprotein NlpE involved in copper resistance